MMHEVIQAREIEHHPLLDGRGAPALHLGLDDLHHLGEAVRGEVEVLGGLCPRKWRRMQPLFAIEAEVPQLRGERSYRREEGVLLVSPQRTPELEERSFLAGRQ